MRGILLLYLFHSSAVFAQQFTPHELGLVAPLKPQCTSVKDQYLTATCWSFSSNSLLESELLRVGKNIDLSEMFVARYSMVRKIHRHLKLKGQNFFTPGGQFHDMIWVLQHYGMVPESVYNGKADNGINHNHGEMDTVLSHFVKEMLSRGISEMNAQQERFVDSVLDQHLGKVPQEFTYNGVLYTPHSFAQRILEFKPEDFVEITSYTHHPFYTSFVLEDKYNWTGDKYYNVTIEDFVRITDQALAKGYTVGWDGDAQDSGFYYENGLAYLSEPVSGSDQLARQIAFENESTLLDHMMHIVGRVKDKQGRPWYYIKNSWGNYSNPLGGFLFMRDDYFRMRTVAIIVNKQAIPADIRKKFGW